METATPTPVPTDTPVPLVTPTPTPTPTVAPAPSVDPAATDHLAHLAATADVLLGVVVVFALTITFIQCVLLVRALR